MSEILVLVDHADGAVKKVTLELLTKARELAESGGHSVAAVFIGSGFDTSKEKLAEYGAAKVYVADAADLDGYVVAPKAELLAKVIADTAPAAVLIGSTAEGPAAGSVAGVTGSGGFGRRSMR